MMKAKRRFTWGAIAVGAALGGAVLASPLFVGEAEAIVGRPLTPMSYAGVARRTTRRAVVAGAAVSPGYGYPAPVAVPVPAPVAVPVPAPPPPPAPYPYYW